MSAAKRQRLVDRATPLLRWGNRLEVASVRRFGVTPLSVIMRIDVVVLETIGARTGTTRSTVVAAVPGPDDSLLIGGGAAGRSCTPDWVANLRANPSVAVTRSRRHYSAVAEELHNEARDAALVAIAEQWPAVEGYERRSGRRTPVFHLEPESATAPS